MKKRNLSFLAAAIGLTALFLQVGCEVDSTDEAQITVEPGYVTLSRGQSATFTASGWDRYQWSLSNTGIGRLSATTGKQVVYTAIGSPAAGVETIQTITASATVNSSSNGTTTVASGSASVLHR